MGQNSAALANYKKAMKLFQLSRPRRLPDIASSYRNIGSVYSDMGQQSEALSNNKKAREIQEKSLLRTVLT